MTSTDFTNYSKVEKYNKETTNDIADFYIDILTKLGEDPKREGLAKTPERVAKALQFLTSGYKQDAAKILRGAMFKEDYSEMVIVKDIELYSMCEHHILPFLAKHILPTFPTVTSLVCPKYHVLLMFLLAGYKSKSV